MDDFTVRNGEVEIPVSVDGQGPPALFVPGMSITCSALGELVEGLRTVLRLATFDLRGHGASSAADDYSYAAFAADTATVVDALGAEGPLILIGFSLGGDLALDQAAVRPETPAVFLLDGGTPLSAPFLDEQELAQMADHIRSEPPEHYALTAEEHVAALREIDAHRRTAVSRFDAVTCPVTMVMSETIAGTDDERSLSLNDQWRRGVDELASTRPSIEVLRLPGGHDLPLVHAGEVVEIVRARVSGRIGP